MRRFWTLRLYLLLAVVVVFFSGQLAVGTAPYVHPDEFWHADAFGYFSTHWWPPPLNSDELKYSVDGWSRVFNGELVYLFYGRLHALVQPALQRVERGLAPAAPYPTSCQLVYRLALPLAYGPTFHVRTIDVQVYRLFNTLLLLITLLILAAVSRRDVRAAGVAVLMLCIPQVTYVYSYGNSDAWGLSCSIFLFLFALTQTRPLSSWRSVAGLGVLTGLLLLAKESFWVAIPYAYLLILWNVWKSGEFKARARWRALALRVAMLGLLVLLIAAPLRIVYAATQANYTAKVAQMREERALPGYKPSNLSNVGYRLSDKGTSIMDIVRNPWWYRLSLKSFYGVFGYMNVHLPAWVYAIAGMLILLCTLLTAGIVAKNWSALPGASKVLLLAAPGAMLLSVLASLYNSWTYDLQPQGRYLFAAIIPLGLLFGGAINYEGRWVRTIRAVAWVLLSLLSLYVLWQFAVLNPALRN